MLDVSRLIWRRWVGLQPTGIDRVCLAYLGEFAGRSRAVIQYHGYRRILDRQRSAWLFDLVRNPAPNFRRQLVLGLARSVLSRKESGNGQLYLNLGHTGLDQDGLAAWVDETGVRPVYFVHDLIPITHPQFCRSGELDKHRRRMLTVLETATGIIGNSQATLDDLATFAEVEGRPMPTSIAAWLGSDQPVVERDSPGAEPAFVALGTIEARKNHMMLLDLWAALVERLGPTAPRLLLIGQRGWKCDDVFDRLAHDGRLAGKVVELNHCSDTEAFRHLTGARALLFPSLAEGFGLPLVEALAIGTPVIASDLPVFREIGQGVPELLDPGAVGEWNDAIMAYSDLDNPRRRAQVNRLRGFVPFTWPDHFAAIGPWLAKL
ncbi:MAG TPA: glycosyltransferase family 1 protein [Sphingomicrobium sp.]|nr:glycosyltransferase family 1 protein [Sphingomicrobium sp.]